MNRQLQEKHTVFARPWPPIQPHSNAEQLHVSFKCAIYSWNIIARPNFDCHASHQVAPVNYEYAKPLPVPS